MGKDCFDRSRGCREDGRYDEYEYYEEDIVYDEFLDERDHSCRDGYTDEEFREDVEELREDIEELREEEDLRQCKGVKIRANLGDNDAVRIDDDFEDVQYEEELEEGTLREAGTCGRCSENSAYNDYIGEVEVKKGPCHCWEEDECDCHTESPWKGEACFKQECDCHDSCFEPCKPKEKCAKLQVVKSVDRKEALDGETLRYCIKIKNVGNTTAFNIRLKDILPCGLTLVPGSLRVKGCTTCHSGNLSNLALGSLDTCGCIIVSFDARIACGTRGIVRNSAEVSYCYMPFECGDIRCTKTNSNVVETRIMNSAITLEKTANRSVVSVGDELVYRIKASNCSEIGVENFTLRDVLPSEVACLEVKANGRTYPCSALCGGLNLGDLCCGETKDIYIRTRVQDFPTDGTIENRSTATFSRNGQVLCPISSNTVATTVILYMCREAKVRDTVKVPCSKGPVHNITDAKAWVKIVKVEELSQEQCDEHGNKRVLIDGLLKLRIKYVTCSGCEQTITRDIKFCITMKVPKSFVYNKNYCINIEPKEVCTKIYCGFDIITVTKLKVCINSI